MAKKTNKVKLLKEMIVARKGNFDIFLTPTVEAAAAQWNFCEKLQDELMGDSCQLTVIAVGSMGQQKTEINPLIAAYDKAQRTLLAYFSALGLSFEANPDRVNNTQKPGDVENDPMAMYLNSTMKR